MFSEWIGLLNRLADSILKPVAFFFGWWLQSIDYWQWVILSICFTVLSLVCTEGLSGGFVVLNKYSFDFVWLGRNDFVCVGWFFWVVAYACVVLWWLWFFVFCCCALLGFYTVLIYYFDWLLILVFFCWLLSHFGLVFIVAMVLNIFHN